MSTTDNTPRPTTRNDLEALDTQEFAILTTYRRSGVAVPTTVWFAHDDDILYVQTGPEAGKLKRIRANGDVALTPSTRVGEPLGTTMTARAPEPSVAMRPRAPKRRWIASMRRVVSN